MVVENITGEIPQKSPFIKAVKNIRSLINKGKVQVQEPKGKKLRRASKPAPAKSQDQSQDEPKEKTTGPVVYLSHLPHGFEEKGIRNYLEQFGKVSGVKLVRSKKTGRSRGFAFVEFAEKDVADIVVSTMNNYLMYKHIVKAELLAPSKDGENPLRVIDSTPIKPENTRTARCRQSYLRKRDKVLDEKSERRVEAHTRRNLRRLQRKLEARGIAFQIKAGKNKWNAANSGKGEDAGLKLAGDKTVAK